MRVNFLLDILNEVMREFVLNIIWTMNKQMIYVQLTSHDLGAVFFCTRDPDAGQFVFKLSHKVSDYKIHAQFSPDYE